MNLLKLVCIDSLHADIAAKQINTDGYRAVIIGRAVITNHKIGNSLSKIIVESNAYTDTVTQFDIECWEQSK
jgi:hypothetical protein